VHSRRIDPIKRSTGKDSRSLK